MSAQRTGHRRPTIAAIVLCLAVVSLASCEPKPAPTFDCPCTLFDADQTPVTPDAGDAGPAEVGVRFSSDTWGFVSGVRFYKAAADTGTHTASLWTDHGTRLATATYTDETESGWQQVDFDQPVPVPAGGTYVVSYHTDTGHYAADHGFFDTAYDNAPLHAPADGARGNGVYHSGASEFPSSSYRATNYWVDPVFVTAATDTVAPRVVATTPTAGAPHVEADTTISATFSEPVLGATVTVTPSNDPATPVAGTIAYDVPTSTSTFTPDTPLGDGTYTVTVAGATDLTANTMAAPFTWSFDVGEPHCPCSIWPEDATPRTVDAQDTGAATVGTRFRTDTTGYITGIRFYKAPANTGTHTGHVWTSQGTLLGTVTFTDETASGWQTATFANPIAVDPSGSYIVSYYAPDGHYSADNGAFALRGVDNRPLHADQDCCGTSNGVYHTGADAFPASSWASTNYWVDVVFEDSATDTVAPEVRSTTPRANATGVPVDSTVTATFSEPVDPATVAMHLTTTDGTTIGGAVTYDPTTLTATLTPATPLPATGPVTATVTAADDLAGNALAAPTQWTFTAEGDTSLWDDPTPAVVDAGPSDQVELGTRFATSTPGFVTGVRFYKSSANTGVHTASLWTGGGHLLATATFTDETGSGWQRVDFDRPVPLSVGGPYVVSYHTDTGHYSADRGYFADSGHCTGPLCAYRDGDGGGNGVFADGPSSFPTRSYESTNYWVDPIFTTTATDTTAPEVVTRGPLPDATDVAPQTPVTVGFDEPIVTDPLTFTVSGQGTAPVAGAVTYDTASRTATFTPDDPLAPATTYTVDVDGATDPAGNTMTAPVQWSFTTRSGPHPTTSGGSILLVTSPTDPSSSYLGEILHAEGLNEFGTTSAGALTTEVLAHTSVLLLAPQAVDPATVDLLEDWVTGGGHLIAIRPDPALDALVGLGPTSGTAQPSHLMIDTSQPPGSGLASSPIRLHGTADLHTVDGARAIASFTGTGPGTGGPAVTEHDVGAGSAAAITYDLAGSIIRTRQGNPAWAGQHRLGTSPIRSTDLFSGSAAGDPQPDWFDPDQVAVPTADVQQRLLANLITTLAATTQPIPRFWYLPNGNTAAVMLTGDDHGHGGTTGRFDQLAAESPPGCSVAAWTCLRATSYIFPGTPISNAEAVQYTAEGFEIGLHTSTGCNDFTETSLNADFTEQLAALHVQLPGIPAPSSNRTHCVVWSTWLGEPRAEAAHGIRLDTNYYWWPPQLAAGSPGLFTGSGIPMRFADTDGSVLDVYQVPTQITDESDQPEPGTIDTLLDNATGPAGAYAVIGVNAHTDSADSPTADAVIDSARRHGVPVISARQLLTWLDARENSGFSSLSWDAGTATFSLTADPAAVGLQAMVPLHSAAAPFSTAEPGVVQSITIDATAVPYATKTVKGVAYAVFPAASGTCTVTYGRP